MSTPEQTTNDNVSVTLYRTLWNKVRRALIVAATAKAAQMNTDISTAIMIGPSTETRRTTPTSGWSARNTFRITWNQRNTREFVPIGTN